ncbi:MAG: VTT domain-containing protein [Myxococcota bacterium]|jgi:uncharacterized membrane protein YdjX (TVP38/TMEM64 family)|nr:VTT domain-containing protein [Myxococcota bacterium]
MEAPRSSWQKLGKTVVTLALVAGVLFGAQLLRERLGIELTAESIQQTVQELGLLAPIGYVLLTMFRQVLAMPSILVLTSAGLLFGAPMGTLLGGIGITLNAFTLYTIARVAGRDWVLPRLHERYPDFEARSRTAGPWVIALMTGHPMGVLTPFHFTAGVTGITVPAFFVAVFPAAIFRAACYAYLGANLLDSGSSGLWIASAVLVAAAVLPLAHPGLRARLLKGKKKSGDPETGSPP